MPLGSAEENVWKTAFDSWAANRSWAKLKKTTWFLESYATNQTFIVCEIAELLFQLAFTPVKPSWIVSTAKLRVNAMLDTTWSFGSLSAPVILATTRVLVRVAPLVCRDATACELGLAAS